MSEFDDLFDRGIPREVALEFVDELLKLAVSMNWVHKAVTKASKDAPTDRLLEVAGRSARGATAAASAGNSSAVQKRLLVKNKALGEALHRGSQKAAALKEAVSTDWVARTARSAVRDAGPARAQEVGKGTMKNVLNAVKNKAPQASVDKRMALHHAVTSPQRLSVGSVSAPAMRKAAAVLAKYAAKAPPSREERQGPAPEQIILQEQQGQVAQATAENQALRSELDAVQGASQENAQAAEQAGMMAQQGQEELMAAQQQGEELQMQAADAMAQVQEAQTEAQVHAQEAAQQADAKMRIAIRLQQMRQQMADMASTDPVAEEGEAVDPIETATQQGGGTPEEQAALEQQAAAEGGDPAADPAAGEAAPPGGGAPPAKKPAPKAKAEPKEKAESKAPKTEIKVGSSNTYMKELAGRLAKKGGGKDLTAAVKKVSPSVAKAFGDVGTHAGMQLQKRALLKEASAGVPRVPKAQGLGKRVKEIWTGSRMKALNLARDDEFGSEAGKHMAMRMAPVTVGAGVAGAGLGALHGTAKGLKDRDKETTKKAGAVDLSKAKGVVGRAKELLSGSRQKKLQNAVTSAARRTQGVLNGSRFMSAVHGAFGDPADGKVYRERAEGLAKGLLKQHEKRHTEHRSEALKSLSARAGAVATVAGGSAAVRHTKNKEKKACATFELDDATIDRLFGLV